MQSPVRGGGLWVWYVNRPVSVASDGWKHVPGTEPGKYEYGHEAHVSDAGFLGSAAQTGLTHVLVKAGDGPNVWPQFTRELVDEAHGLGLKCVAWNYCYLDDPHTEAVVALNAIRQGADGLVLDVEYEIIQHGTQANASKLVSLIRSGAPDSWVGYSPDLRIAFGNAWPRGKFNPDLEPWPWADFNKLDGCLPQLYWTDFQQTPEDTVRMVGLWMQGCSDRGWPVPAVYPVMPGNATGDQMQRGCDAAKDTYGGASVWRWGSTFNGNMATVGGTAWKPEDDTGDPAPVPEEPAPAPDPGTGGEPPVEGSGPDPRRDALVLAMETEAGRPYVWAGKDHATGYDCSGLITDKAKVVGLDLGDPYYTNANSLKKFCSMVPEPMRGDIVLFVATYVEPGTDIHTYATHCGVVTDPDRSIMVDTHGDPWPGVGHTDYSKLYWQQHLLGFFRPNDYLDSILGEDPAVIDELNKKLERAEWYIGYVRGTVGDDLERALEGVKNSASEDERATNYQYIGDVLNTLRHLGEDVG
jgi:cell wall-associated NlpC family hydrolase